ncbi:hypothetical protein CR970_01675 [Candidatus Saccharibacteria bacterium]|nr:MAG: hypothetical protein CR970_01675 [Candidatus Saccharibacteria bacterium]
MIDNTTDSRATYNLKTVSDDGIRVYIDGVAWINEWSDHGAKSVNVSGSLDAGTHEIVVEYYENGYDSVQQVELVKL